MTESVSPVPLVRNCLIGGQQACLAIEASLGRFVGVEGKHPVVTEKCSGCKLRLSGHVIGGELFIEKANNSCPKQGASHKNLN